MVICCFVYNENTWELTWLCSVLCLCPRLHGVVLYVTMDVKSFLASLNLSCLIVLTEKKISCSEDKNGGGECGMPCRHAKAGFSVLIHTAAAAHVYMEMRMNSNLGSAGKQINKDSFRLQTLW